MAFCSYVVDRWIYEQYFFWTLLKVEENEVSLTAKHTYHFDESASEKPIYFIEKYCRHSQGEKAGENFVLTDWQKEDIIKPAFGWLDEQGRRKHRFTYVELPKGQGKSALLSAICLYVACFDGATNAEIYCVAGDRFQARIIFETCKEMVKADKRLMKACQIRRDHITHIKSGSKIMVISADAKKKHGFRPYFIAFDELHVQPNRELYDTLTRGLMKMWNSMCFMITTAGVKNTFAETIHDYALQIKNKIEYNPVWHAVIYAADESDDPFDPATWKKANPGLGTIIDEENFAVLANEARIPSALNAFKQLHLNIWTGSVEAWVPPHIWKNCQGELPPDEYLAGLPCYLGLDKSSTTDLTSIAAIFDDKENGVVYQKVWTICPEATIADKARKEHVNYLAWVKQGWLTVSPGNTQDDRFLLKMILNLADQYKVKLVAYDPWAAASMMAELYTDHQIEVLKIPQNLSILSEPTKWCERAMYDGRIMDDTNPIFAWAVQNVMIFRDSNDNVRPHKGKSKGRIDPVIAVVNAVAGKLEWDRNNPEPRFFGDGFTFLK